MPVESQPSRHWTDGVLSGKADLPVDYTSAGTAPEHPALLPATPFTTETADNLVAGDGTMTVLVFPEATSVLAIKIEGDEYPRLILGSHQGDGIHLGDGTFDPMDGQAAVKWEQPGNEGTLALLGNSVGGVPIAVRPGMDVNGDVSLHEVGQGFVLWSPNSTLYRIKVANDGTLSTEAVV